MIPIEPVPTSVDWPRLVAIAERRNIPVLRMDCRGDQHIIRSVAQLRDEWEDDA